jgi:hypothetical protein
MFMPHYPCTVRIDDNTTGDEDSAVLADSDEVDVGGI